MTRVEADAEDLLQDLVLKLYDRYDELKEVDNLGIWLDKVMYRMFVDRSRKLKASPLVLVEDCEHELSGGQGSKEAPVSLRPDMQLEKNQLIEALEFALGSLGENQRLVIMLFEIEGYSLLEISEITGFPLGTIKTWLRRGREKLRDYISDDAFLESQEMKQ